MTRRGEPIPVSHMIPRSREDLRAAARRCAGVAEYSVGLMGRTPDYMNVTYAGFAGNRGEWANHGNEAGAERLVAYQKFLRRGDISLTHTIVQPTVDKATGDAPQAGNPTPCARSPTPSTASSCAARASSPPWRRSPTRSRSIRRCRCPPAPTPIALSFCIPIERARPEIPVPRQRLGAGQPLRPSPVEPLRRAGRLRDLRRRRGPARPAVHRRATVAAYNSVMTTSWPPNIQQQTMIRASVKLDFAWGLRCAWRRRSTPPIPRPCA